MVTSCVAYGCTNRMKKGGNLSFQRFPHNKPDLLHKWVQAVRRQNWYPNKNSLICSVHFTESCFTVTPGNQCHWLQKNAIPSVFPQFPKHLQKTESKRKSPVKRKFVESKTSTFEPSPSKSKSQSIQNMHIFQKKHLMQKLRKSQKKFMLCIKKFADGKNELRTWKTC